jgi:hypothetical protein
MERRGMPVIARFYGIAVKMYFREHGTAHFHALYGESSGVFEVSTLEMIEGDLPSKGATVGSRVGSTLPGRLAADVGHSALPPTARSRLA